MGALQIAAGGLALLGGFLFWRLRAAWKKLGALSEQLKEMTARLKVEAKSAELTIHELRDQIDLLSARIRDLGGEPPPGLRIDPDTGEVRRA